MSGTSLVRKLAPAFTADAVLKGAFTKVSRDSLNAGGKYAVLAFYPLDFTFVCPTEITAFSDAADKFAALNTNVAMVSVDSKFSHLAWTEIPRNKGGLGTMEIPVISDITKEISRNYGALITDPEDGDCGVALRTTVIIDGKGVVRYISHSDLPVGRNVEEILRLVAAFQFTDEHGEVCPSNWKPGSKSMKADPKGSQEYFQTLA